MPPGFDYPERSTMFWTAHGATARRGTRAFGNFVVLLKPDVSLVAATEEANVIGDALRTPTPVAGYGASASPAPPAPPATRDDGRTAGRRVGTPRIARASKFRP